MPRTKIHADAAARSRAWRERKRNASATEPQPENEAPPGVAQAPFKIVGSKGQVLAVIREDDSGTARLVLYDRAGQPTAAVGTWQGETKIWLGAEGKAGVMLFASKSGGAISVLGPGGTSAVEVYAKDGGHLDLLEPRGEFARQISRR